MISVADAAQKSKVLDYPTLMRSLDLETVRELEDLIIDCIYNELLSGQLDQLNQSFHVTSCYGRDMRPQDVSDALAKLEAWDRQLEGAQAFIEGKIVAECNKNV
jgi:COP9 signalosome complex subunit 7